MMSLLNKMKAYSSLCVVAFYLIMTEYEVLSYIDIDIDIHKTAFHYMALHSASEKPFKMIVFLKGG